MKTLSGRKILFVITKSNWGGAQKYVYTLATLFREAGADVAVALGGIGEAGAATGALDEQLAAAGIRTIFLQSFTRDLSLWRDAKAFIELLRVVRKECPDVLHLNSSKAGGLGALAARVAHIPRIVFTAHGWPFREKRNFAWRTFAFFGSWASALLSHAIIVVSKSDLQAGRNLPWCVHKMRLVYNGIDLHMPFGSGEIIRNAFPEGVRITGTVGELTKNKNQIALIEQARDDSEMFVAIVGEGEDRTMLEEAIQKYHLEQRVKLFGFIPAQEVLKGFDLFALPSLKEGLPYVLIEARVADLPIVANRVGGVGEILDATDMNDFSLEKMLEKTTELYSKDS